MTKIDFKKTLACYKAKNNHFSIVEIPKLQYLMIDGENGPGSKDYIDAIQSLYPVAYKLKFMSKLELGKDYVVPPLESLWWANDMTAFTTNYDKSEWLWTAMIMTPDWITKAMFDEAVNFVQAKKNLNSLSAIHLSYLEEATSVQTLHLGSYSDEGPVLEKMHKRYIPDNGFEMKGKHHEIYFNDFRKVASEKLRTILRHPIVRSEF